MTSTFHSAQKFTLESGEYLPELYLTYTTLGQLNPTHDNVVWIFHGLTANSNPLEWWHGLVGEGKYLDPSDYFIICVNTPGSPYGSSSPVSQNPLTGDLYHADFPVFTIRDMVSAFRLLKNHIGIQKIFLGLGGSTGGMQLLEWAIEEPDLFEYIVPIATNAFFSPWGIALNASQRMAIEADTSWNERRSDAGKNGLVAARSIAMLSYRSYSGFSSTQRRDKPFLAISPDAVYAADNYQRYQGGKLANRFNAFCYYRLTQSMDSHDVGRNRGGLHTALSRIEAKALVIGILSDILFPLREQELLRKYIRGAELATITSDFGHDGFLLEFQQIENALAKYVGHRVRQDNN